MSCAVPSSSVLFLSNLFPAPVTVQIVMCYLYLSCIVLLSGVLLCAIGTVNNLNIMNCFVLCCPVLFCIVEQHSSCLLHLWRCSQCAVVSYAV